MVVLVFLTRVTRVRMISPIFLLNTFKHVAHFKVLQKYFGM